MNTTMNLAIKQYFELSFLFEYPDETFTSKVKNAHQTLAHHYPHLEAHLQPFTDYISQISLREQQELFLRSFDVQAVTTLDLGYVMFGDDYKRGELLVNLNREHREVQNDCGVELSDHLPNVLRLLPKMKDVHIVEELVQRIIAPALSRMIKGFDPDQIILKEKFYKSKHKTIIDRPEKHYTIYQKALEVLYLLLKHDFQFEDSAPIESNSDFLKNIVTEVKLEG